MNRLMFGLVLILGFSHSTWSQEGTGLEWGQEIEVVIGKLNGDALAAGLTKEGIRARCEQAFNKAGLVVSDRIGSEGHLYVHIAVADVAFNVQLRFERLVRYQFAGATYKSTAATWKASSTGTHGGTSDFILQTLDAHLDTFASEFRKANPKIVSGKR